MPLRAPASPPPGRRVQFARSPERPRESDRFDPGRPAGRRSHAERCPAARHRPARESVSHPRATVPDYPRAESSRFRLPPQRTCPSTNARRRPQPSAPLPLRRPHPPRIQRPACPARIGNSPVSTPRRRRLPFRPAGIRRRPGPAEVWRLASRDGATSYVSPLDREGSLHTLKPRGLCRHGTSGFFLDCETGWT